jgi:hypothetical protein
MSVRLAHHISGEYIDDAAAARRSVIPVAVLLTLITLTLLWLFIG